MARFKVVLQQEEVIIEQKDGSEKKYVIKEMTGRDMEAYLNEQRKNIVLNNGVVVGMKTFEGMYATLLSKTIYDDDGLVLRPDIDLWPSSLQKELFQIAQKLSGLGKDEAEGGN